MTLLFDDTHRPTELRPAFRDPGQSEILPQVARWLIRRYAFREARHLLGAWRRSDEVGGLFWNLRLQRSWLPRLAATAAVAAPWRRPPRRWQHLGGSRAGCGKTKARKIQQNQENQENVEF